MGYPVGAEQAERAEQESQVGELADSGLLYAGRWPVRLGLGVLRLQAPAYPRGSGSCGLDPGGAQVPRQTGKRGQAWEECQKTVAPQSVMLGGPKYRVRPGGSRPAESKAPNLIWGFALEYCSSTCRDIDSYRHFSTQTHTHQFKYRGSSGSSHTVTKIFYT